MMWAWNVEVVQEILGFIACNNKNWRQNSIYLGGDELCDKLNGWKKDVHFS